LSHIVDAVGKEDLKGEEYEIEIKKLDDLQQVNAPGKKVVAIKIDVEGYEYLVVKGAQELIKKNKPVIYCELWGGPERVKTVELMKSLNYSVKVVQDDKLVDYTNQDKVNFFFVPA
jgi:hypothetical protein